VKHVKNGLGGLLAVCIIVRVGAWLLAPLIPALIILFCLVAIVTGIAGGPRRFS